MVINELKKNGLIDNYALGGGIAALFYIEPFLTYDLDVFIILSRKQEDNKLILLSPLFDYLQERGYSFKGKHIIIEGVPVQFIASDDLEKEAVSQAREIEFEGIKTRIIAPEYLLAICLRAGRNQDRDRVEKLLKTAEIKAENLMIL